MPTADHTDLEPLAERALSRLGAAGPETPGLLETPGFAGKLRQLAIASDFAIATLGRQPALLQRLAKDEGAAPLAPPKLDADNRSDWPTLLRVFRAAESTRLVWRDVLGLDDVDATLAGSTHLAETCLQIALAALETEFAQRHGVVRAADGSVQRLVVFGLGKLGGGELNFSSDVDLVYGYESEGESDGPRVLAAADYFARLGQQLARLLDEATADGFCHRVDLRLRPFGNAGRVALSFAAMEQYFQREGRDWERYAWQKARPVAGDIGAGERFLQVLRPFVYRRYLDYGALDGLREMKAAIAAEVARKDLADDIKRGPGGIREIEFLVQALQLIRGGREPVLRECRLQPALLALVAAQHVSTDAGDALAAAYRFLRKLENRLQMLRDAQTHALPADPGDRARIAQGMGYEGMGYAGMGHDGRGHAGWQALRDELDMHRARVTAEFEVLLAPRRRDRDPGALAAYWRALPDQGEAATLADAGFDDPQAADASLRDFARAPGVRALSDASRARLDRVLPALLQAAAHSAQADAALKRLLPLLHNILRRASYLALLDEQPSALQRVVDVLARSALLGERLAAHPLLLDELLDVRVGGPLPQPETLLATGIDVLAHDDTEAALQALNEWRQALSFRIALATLDGRQPARDSARQLAWLAEAVIAGVLQLAQRELQAAHGTVLDARFAVLGYGSLGGEELGFGSDLDLVFVYDAASAAQSDGARPLDASRWFARLAQKVVGLLGTVTGAGRLFDVDVRLRPDGAKGLLVSSMASFAEYQRDRAWTWEHQALVRARCIAGDRDLCAQFERVREATLAGAREIDVLHEDVLRMRAKMRAELDRSEPDRSEPDRSTPVRFDIKQGEGGLVDLEFLLQFLVLRDAAHAPALLGPRDTPALLEAFCEVGVFAADSCIELKAAHAVLLDAGLRCTLDRRPRITVETAAIAAARAVIRKATLAGGLDFGVRGVGPGRLESGMDESGGVQAQAPAH